MYRRLVTAIIALSLLAAGPALAAKSGGNKQAPPGRDVSYPQCSARLSTGQAFGIVGLNGGAANNFNPCLTKEYSWAAQSAGGTSQPRAQLYINTGNPGALVVQYSVMDWPASNTVPGVTTATTDPYGACTLAGTIWVSGQAYQYGPDNQACAWQYGYNKGYADYQRAVAQKVASPQALPWWLDVETANSWDSGTAGQSNNVAVLEGFVAVLESDGVSASHLGIYSTTSQWNTIVGTQPGGPLDVTGALSTLTNWQAGASNLSGAQAECFNAPLYGTSIVTLVQYTTTSDYDYSCFK